jgi:thiamine-monophosphate kinase
MPDIRKLGEQGIIDLFKVSRAQPPITKSIGDDCAAIRLPGGKLLLWTTDMLIEGIHFERRFGTPKQLGAKSLAVNLSDIAAMGGRPIACLLALSLPHDLEQNWISEFRDGFTSLAERHGCPLIGGDTCGGREEIAISVTVLGEVPEDQVLWRSGAHDGDDIWVSGIPGTSALGLRILADGGDIISDEARIAVNKHLDPEPRLEPAEDLAESGQVTACIDTSDGIAVDLGHLCGESHLGALLEESLLPLPAIPPGREDDPLELALQGGEDYELLFTAAPAARVIFEKVRDLHRIGKMDESSNGVFMQRSDGGRERITPRGFSHF